MISVDTDVLRRLAAASQNATQELEAASYMLNQVTVHNDWGCRERVTINAYIQSNRKKMQSLMEASRSFSNVMEQVMDEFVQTERCISDMFETVESMIGSIVAIPVAGAALPSIKVADFKKISQEIAQ